MLGYQNKEKTCACGTASAMVVTLALCFLIVLFYLSASKVLGRGFVVVSLRLSCIFAISLAALLEVNQSFQRPFILLFNSDEMAEVQKKKKSSLLLSSCFASQIHNLAVSPGSKSMSHSTRLG